MYGASLQRAAPWIENFKTRLDAIIDQIEDKFPGGCEFFVANVYDPTDGVGDAENAGLPAWPDGLKFLDAYNRIIAGAAEKRKNVTLVEMHDLFLGHGIHCLKFWQKHYDAKDPRTGTAITSKIPTTGDTMRCGGCFSSKWPACCRRCSKMATRNY